MAVKDRFLRYIQVETTSDESSATCPSSPKEWDLIHLLVDELKALGLQARSDEHGYVYATIPAKGKDGCIGLIAHMDTSDAVKGPTHPVCIPDYDGSPVTLKNGIVIDDAFLPALRGQELIVTDGTSVLGADDKAGVAEIMQLCEELTRSDAPDHCQVAVAFTPDEEIGRGADLFDVEHFGADFAYTVDGGAVGEMEYENFNAASLIVTVRGLSFHPGDAKGRMKNAGQIAMQFHSLLPAHMRPEHTEGYEGFYHLIHMEGDCEKAELTYIIRDHDRSLFEEKKALCLRIRDLLNQEHGEGTVECLVKDSYYNMREKLEPRMDILDRARAAFEKENVTPSVQPIRGGTDGARLSFMGLLCPNLSTGGYNFHSRKECITREALETMVKVLKNIVTA
ncbi:MAG: peptidase T [Clostridia bacterium]|nr:peptidase T [Clostridia bacterium]